MFLRFFHFIALTFLTLWACSPPTSTSLAGSRPALSEADIRKRTLQSPLRESNSPPIIQGLSANPTDRVGLSETLSFTIQAHDPDGDSLKYFWHSNQGKINIQEDGLVAYWQPQQLLSRNGIASIDVTVSDGKGGQTQGDIKIYIDAKSGQAQVRYIARQTCAEGAERFEELFSQ